MVKPNKDASVSQYWYVTPPPFKTDTPMGAQMGANTVQLLFTHHGRWTGKLHQVHATKKIQSSLASLCVDCKIGSEIFCFPLWRGPLLSLVRITNHTS